MDTHPFRTARSYLDATPVRKWGARLASAGTAVALVLLLPVVYLFVDLLVWRGAVPRYAGLTAVQQLRFRDEWENALSKSEPVQAVLARVRPESAEAAAGDSDRWEWRWQAATYAALRDRVSQEAADAYLTLPESQDPARPAVAAPTGNRLGILSLFARERPRWTTGPVGWVARHNPWAWRPDAHTAANTSYLAGLFVLAFALAALHAGLMFAADHLAAAATLDAVGRMRRNVFAHANRIGAVAVRPQASAEAADLFTRKVEAVQEGLRAWLRHGWRAPLATVLLLAVLLASHFWLTLCALLVGAVVWLVGGQFAAWFRRDGRLAARRAEARLAQMRESVGIMQLVKSYLMDRFNQARVERQLADHARAEWRRLRGEALSKPALVAAVTFAAVAGLYLAGRAVLLGDMSVAALATKVAAIAALVPAVSLWVSARVKVARAADAAAAVSEFLDRRADPGQPIDAEFLQPMARKLELVEVSVREPGGGRMLLDNVSLAAPSGSRVAVVGSDPEEVHTLAYLLTRFVDPTGGEVRIDGKNTRWVTHESVRTQVALVAQQNLIFSDTVANNIGCGDPGFSLPQIIEAAKVAHAHQFVQKLPYGYETPIGDGGHSLHRGEKLRIGLARAVLRDPSVIVIEEPDAPMDDDSRALLDDSYERIRPGRTLVFLSRRAAVLRAADRVVVLHRGRLAAAGTHDELMQTSELYRHLLFNEITAPAAAAGVS